MPSLNSKLVILGLSKEISGKSLSRVDILDLGVAGGGWIKCLTTLYFIYFYDSFKLSSQSLGSCHRLVLRHVSLEEHMFSPEVTGQQRDQGSRQGPSCRAASARRMKEPFHSRFPPSSTPGTAPATSPHLPSVNTFFNSGGKSYSSWPGRIALE